MAIGTPVQRLNSTDNNNLSATFTKNVSANTTAGNHLIGVFANEDATPVSVSDALNGTWNNAVTRALNGACAQILVWVKLTSALTTSDNITFTKAASGNRPSLVGLWEVSGLEDSAFDVGSGTGAGTGTTMATGTTAVTAQNNEIVFAFWAMDTDVAFTLDATYTAINRMGPAAGGSSGGNGHVVDGGYKILSATGAQTATSTRGAGAVAWTATIATFKEAAGGGVSLVHRNLMLGVGT